MKSQKKAKKNVKSGVQSLEFYITDEYSISANLGTIRCLKYSNGTTPFLFFFTGRIVEMAALDIKKILEDPVKKNTYIRTRLFDKEEFDKGLSSHAGIVFSSYPFKILLLFGSKFPKMAVYKINDRQDEFYYKALQKYNPFQ